MYEHGDDWAGWNQPQTMRIWQLLLAGLFCFGLGSLSAGESPFPTGEVAPTVTSLEIRVSASMTSSVRAERAPFRTPETVVPTAVVPEVVGLDLESAHDAVEAAGFHRVIVYDALGYGRNQILDSNWVVVSQTPIGGLSASIDTLFELRAKRMGE